MLIIVKNSLVIGLELKYNIKQKLDSLDKFFKLIKMLNNKIKNNEINYTKIDTNKNNIYLINIDDDVIMEIIQNKIKLNNTKKDNNNIKIQTNQISDTKKENILEFNEIDFDLNKNNIPNKKEKIQVGIEKSFEDFSSFFWNN